MEQFMEKALELAREALTAKEVPVGCIFVVDGEIVASSRNTVNETRNPTRHAEINCIDKVFDYCNNINVKYSDYLKNIEVFVTVEPCIMCAAALNNLSVKKVIYGCENDRFGGKTVVDVAKYYEKSYDCVGGVFSREAMELLKSFYQGTNPLAPKAKLKKKNK